MPEAPTQAPPPPVSPGDMVAGKYRIDRMLGKGGMGVVFAARQVELDREVAIKFALRGLLQSPEAVERFVREARAAVKLRSEHVARVLDVGRLPSGEPYMVMEYLEGTTVGALLEAGPLPVDVACNYVVQACEAIAEAHSLGIVHRDIKPDNLFVTRSVGGEPLVKVLDFGISKVTEIDGVLTTTSAMLGTPLYMAPEQMRSARNADARSDIWALGVILYLMLGGKPPFRADTLPELCLRVVQEPHTPLTRLRESVPPGLAAAVDRCLEKEASKRFASVGELASALEPYAPASSHHVAARARSVLSAVGSRAPMPSSPEQPPAPTTRDPTPARAVVVERASALPTGPTLLASQPAAPMPPGLTSVHSQTNSPVVSRRADEAGRRGPKLLLATLGVLALALIALGARVVLRTSTEEAPAPPGGLVLSAVPPPSGTPALPTVEPAARAHPAPSDSASAEPMASAPTPPSAAAATVTTAPHPPRRAGPASSSTSAPTATTGGNIGLPRTRL